MENHTLGEGMCALDTGFFASKVALFHDTDIIGVSRVLTLRRSSSLCVNMVQTLQLQYKYVYGPA